MNDRIESEDEIAQAWKVEIEKRIEAINSGQANARPADQVLAEIKAKYSPRRHEE